METATKKRVKKTTSTPAKPKKEMVKPAKTAAEGLRDLFTESLKDIYWAEKALTKALPKMAKNATNANLAKGLTEHLEETKQHITRLETVFSLLGKKAVAKKCDAMEGLIKEADGILKESEPGAVRDAAIILASQKIEHYEIATYGTLAAFTRTLGEPEAADLLEQTLREEKEADFKLTVVAYQSINFDALTEDDKQ